jgi:hypothetical protein
MERRCPRGRGRTPTQHGAEHEKGGKGSGGTRGKDGPHQRSSGPIVSFRPLAGGTQWPILHTPRHGKGSWHIGGASDPQMPKGGEREGKGSDVPNGGCSAERVPSQRKREEVRGGRRGGRPTKVRKESWCLALAAPIPPTLPRESGSGSVAQGCLCQSQGGMKGQIRRGLGIPAAH